MRVIAQRGVGFHLWTLDGEQVVDDLVCARGELQYFNHRAGCRARGRCNRDEIYRALSLWIEPDGFIHLVNGDPLVLPHTRASERPATGGERVREISLQGLRHRQEIRVKESGDDLLVLSSTIRRAATTEQVAYSHFSRVGDQDTLVPYSAKLVPGGDRPSVVVKWEGIRVDIRPASESFELALPVSAPICPAPAPWIP